MLYRSETNRRYYNGNVRLEHAKISINGAQDTDSFFIGIGDEELVMDYSTFHRLYEIFESLIGADHAED